MLRALERGEIDVDEATRRLAAATMSEELETVLRLVADGTLTPEQAAPIIDALTRAERTAGRDRVQDRDRAGSLARAHRRRGACPRAHRGGALAASRGAERAAAASCASASPSTGARS